MELYRSQDRAITSAEILGRLKPHIRPNSILYIESDVGTFGRLANPDLSKPAFLGELFSIFTQLAGPQGHVIVPTFTYSWGSTSPEKLFDLQFSKSKVGTMSEYVRRHRDVTRTLDPMFSFAIHGPRREELARIENDSFGRSSLFAKLRAENAYLISFGLHKYDPTFVHYIEQFHSETVVPCLYRSRVEFKGELVNARGERYAANHFCFMRALHSRYTFSEKKMLMDLKAKNWLQTETIGAAPVHISDCASVFSVSMDGLNRDPYFLVVEE